MKDKDNTLSLFSILNGCLPYEYDIKLLNYHCRATGILITKKDSGHIMQITPNNHDDTFTVLAYDDGDDPDADSETYQWNPDSPTPTLDDVLTDIKNRL